jgi:hypothetical protein
LLKIPSVAKLLFGSRNDLFFIKNVGVIEVNPLCGTRTFYTACAEHPSEIKSLKYFDLNISYTIVRDEGSRLKSAYNKKVVAVNTDWRKRVLLLASGIPSTVTFREFMDLLIRYKGAGKYIDRHFRPCEINSSKAVHILDFINLCDNKIIKEYLLVNRIKSSFSLASTNPRYLMEFLPEDLARVNQYLEMYKCDQLL